jgi:hypothetical protein
MKYRLTEEDFERAAHSSDDRMSARRSIRDNERREKARKFHRTRTSKMRLDAFGDYR